MKALILALLLTATPVVAEDYRVGDTLYAESIPFCYTLRDAQAIAAYSRENGSGYDKFMELDGCRNGTGTIVVGNLIDAFPDNKSEDGVRSIAEIYPGGDTSRMVYGLFSSKILPQLSGSI